MQRILIAALTVAFALPVLAQDETTPKKIPVTQPVIIKKTEAAYPKGVKKVDGAVMLKLVIAEDGRAKNIEVLKSLTPDFDDNAVAAVKEWVWKPGTKNGEPISVYAQVEVNFRVHKP